jgi:hypothetical protein
LGGNSRSNLDKDEAIVIVKCFVFQRKCESKGLADKAVDEARKNLSGVMSQGILVGVDDTMLWSAGFSALSDYLCSLVGFNKLFED